MKCILIIFGLLSSLFASGVAKAQDPALFYPKGDYAALRFITVAEVAQVIDPLRIRLSDQSIVQLVPLDIPDLDPAEPGEYTALALAFMKTQLEGKQVRIHQTKNAEKGRTNRMGYKLAHLERKEDGTWVQGALLANGFARIRPSADNTEMAVQMLKIQHDAQLAKRGIWADTRYAPHTPETASLVTGGYGVIEGVVRANAMAQNVVYLNFGPDWKTDFSVGIKPEVRRAMAKTGFNPLSFSGKKIRVQGWVENYNGPYINLVHPVWIEVLPDEAETNKVETGKIN